MAITCPNGHVNDDGNRFCDQCGIELGAPSQAPASPDQAAPISTGAGTGSTVCPTCGQENLPGTAFCENCGAQLPPPEPVAAEEPSGATTPPTDTVVEVMDESPASAGADMGEPAMTTPGAQSQPATEAAQPPEQSPATLPPMDEQQPGPSAQSNTPDAGAVSDGGPLAMEEPAREAVMPSPTPPIQPEPATMDVAQPATASAPATEQGAMACSNCGSQLPPNAKFCLECGTKVEQKPRMVQPTNCQNCGSELPPNAKFCLECGTKVELVPEGQAGPLAASAEPTYQQQATEAPVGASATPTVADVPGEPEAPLPSAVDIAMERTDEAAATSVAAPVPDPATSPTSGGARSYDAVGAAQAMAPVVTPPSAPSTPPPPPAQAQPVQSGPRLMSSDGASISLPPKDELVVGREDPVSGIHPDVDLTAHGGEAGGVSRRHAVLRQQGGQWSVTDLDSTNYTRVDGNRITPNTEVPLQDGAQVHFGRVQFEFRVQ